MRLVDQSGWKRKPVCDFFSSVDVPFYSMTARVDAGKLLRRVKAEGGSAFLYTVYASMRAVNSVDAFLYKLRGDTVVRHEFLSPSFTVPAEDDLFKIVTLDWDGAESPAEFTKRARAAMEAQTELFPPAAENRDDVAYLSCIPWVDFTAITNEMPLNREDSIPRFGWGKLVRSGETASMAYGVEVNHRLIDGRHIGLFYEALQRALDGE